MKWLRIIGPRRTLNAPSDPGPPGRRERPNADAGGCGRASKALTRLLLTKSTENAIATPIAMSTSTLIQALVRSTLNLPASQRSSGVNSAHKYICWKARPIGTACGTALKTTSRWSAMRFAAVSTAINVQNAKTPSSSARLSGLVPSAGIVEALTPSS